MDKKLNPITGEFDLVPDSGDLVQKINPLTGEFNLTTESQTYKQIFNPVSGTFNLAPGSKSITGNRYVDIFATSILGYKIYGNTIQRLLPKEYTQLEYIESTGTQYIDLGYKGNGNTKVDIKFKYHTATSTGASGRVFGSRTLATSNAFAIGSNSGTAAANSTISFFFGNQNYLVTDKAIVLDEWLDVIFDKTIHNINGTDYGTPYNDETFETPQNLKLFGFDNDGTMGVGYVDIAYCKLWNNGVLVRNLIPAKRNSDNVIGMYDLVSGTFFTNAGTGTFTAGPTAVPTPEIPFEVKGVGENTVNLLNRPNGTYSADGKGSVTVLNNITTANVQFSTNWSIYKLSGNVDRTNIASSLVQMKEQSTDSVLFKANHTYVVKLFDSTSDYNDLQIANTTTNVQIRDGESFTPTEDMNALWVRMNRDSAGSQTGNKTFKITIVEGSTAPTSYVPYGYQIPVNVRGKNLFDIANADIIDGKYIDDDGSIQSATSAIYTGAYIPVKPNTTYTWSGKDGGTIINYAICEYDADKTFIERHSRHISLDDDTWTTKANTHFLRFNLKKSDTRTTLQLEEGSTATPYEPYLAPTTTNIYTNSPLHKAGDYKDILNSDGTITRNVGVKVLTGTETGWTQHPTYQNLFGLSDTNHGSSTSFCTHFVYAPQNFSNGKFWLTQVYLYFYNSAFNTLADFKTWLASQYANGTPVIIYYPLATSTTETITAPEITLSGEGTYHIEIDTEVDATFDLTYI